MNKTKYVANNFDWDLDLKPDNSLKKTKIKNSHEDLNALYYQDIFNTLTDDNNPAYNNNFTGVISFETIKNGRVIQRTKVKQLEQMENLLHNHIYVKHNCYTTLNSVKGKRGNQNVAGLNALYFDIDTDHQISKTALHKLTFNELLKEESKIGKFQQIQKTLLNNGFKECLSENKNDMTINDELLLPNDVVFSGHGFHLIYFFKSQVPVNNPIMTKKWQYLEDYLGHAINNALKRYFDLEEDIVDFKATDVTRLMRAPLTKNWRDENKPVKCKVIEHNTKRYDFFDLCNNFVPFKKHKKASKPVQSFKRKYTKTIKVGSAYSLNLARASDFNKLVALRHGKCTGQRENLVFYYSYFAGASNSKTGLQKELQWFNLKFTEPLTAKEVNRVYDQYLKTDFMHLNDLKKDDKVQVPNNAKLIEIFDITSEEQTQLNTIIGYDEKLKRLNQKRRKKSATSGAKYRKQERNKKIIELFNAGESKAHIAKKLGMSRTTVTNVLK
ncbi:hypothetical protein [Apilactobacillus micheneri]|uniref:hypothetical protein n=1 Tax=Apilactobacillus micheneri TaxID=1899430 RepID=UPI00112BAE9B|nr:hypothetical protein [Apilactobacillus micheneri]TPR43338.1 hypothetical protein DY128_07365 [Apilactobacillus micheneri]